jgi:hypothetical protein
MLRTYDVIPVTRVVAAASLVSAERGDSFQVRVANEGRLLAKANEKPFFGWGAWARSRVYNRENGADESITDGAWILRYGMFGWLGYLSFFGLFTTAIFNVRSRVKGPITPATITLAALTLILAVNLTDLIPNANLFPLTYLIAGSIAGRSRLKAKADAPSRKRTETPAEAEFA